MPVTELATIFLQEPTTSDSIPLLEILRRAKSVQEKGSGYPAYYFEDTSNPRKFYIIGTWESRESHMAFLPRKENQEVLGLLMPLCATENPVTLRHIDVELKGKEGVGFVDWDGVGVVQYDVESRWKGEVGGWIREPGDRGMLGKFDGFGGWSIEREDEAEEVLMVLTKMTDVGEFLDRSLEAMPCHVPAIRVEHGGDAGTSNVKWSWFKAQRFPGL